jgi:hypothetical protein
MMTLRKLPLLLGLLAGLPLAAQASTEPDTSTGLLVHYRIALGGFNLGNAEINAQFDRNEYELAAAIRTDGIADQFFATSFDLTSQGQFRAGSVRPAQFVSTYASEDSGRTVQLTYGSGIPEMVAEPAYGDGFGPHIRPTDIQRTQDPLSALLVPTVTENANPCERSLPLFDGRRRYDLRLSADGETNLTSDDGGYSGPAVRCAVRMMPIAGYERKTLIKLLQAQDSIRVWVPVRLTMRTPFGGAILRATHFATETIAAAP